MELLKRDGKDINELHTKILKYFAEEKEPTPRHFRIYICMPKSTLSRGKTGNEKQQEMGNLIKDAEDIILAKMEQMFSYGGKAYYNLALTLRAYDTHLYAPESRPINTDADNKDPIIINMENKSGINLKALTQTKEK